MSAKKGKTIKTGRQNIDLVILQEQVDSGAVDVSHTSGFTVVLGQTGKLEKVPVDVNYTVMEKIQ